jgi:predicted glycosyl hydrolase (DUF1957 family)
MLTWINFLHFYQPASMEQYKIIEATDKSYRYIVALLESNPKIKFTCNISGCLIDRWVNELGTQDLVSRIDKLIEGGQIELVGSAAYHALLPLVKEEEAIKQIKEHEIIIQKYLPHARLKGFFLPEMAYGKKIGAIIKRCGYEWVILDEIAQAGEPDALNQEFIYTDASTGLGVIFRERQNSCGYVPNAVLRMLNLGENTTIITATDAELYGLRHIDSNKTLEFILKSSALKTSTVSSYLLEKNQAQAKQKKVELRDCSWESTAKELSQGQPFTLWQNKKNAIHQKLWRLADLAQELHYKYFTDKNHEWSRWHLVRGIASCVFWWASKKDLKHVYGPLAWSPDEVEKGLNEMIRSIRSLEESTVLKEKILAEKYYNDAKKFIWETHWKMKHSTK